MMPSPPELRVPWRDRAVVLAWSVLVSGVVLGPALGRGQVLAYDMAWSPDPRLTPFATGLGSAVPRAVPSDAVAWLLGLLVTPSAAQKLVLMSLLVATSLGAVALLRDVRPAAAPGAVALTGLAAVWNPFVSERLVIGQWTILLGYAVLPWAMRTAARAVGGRSAPWAVAVPMAVAGVGGVNSVVMVGGAIAVVNIAGIAQSPRRALNTLGLAGLVGVGISAAWLIPSLLMPPMLGSDQVRAFAAAADTPLGVLGSLVSGGGFWNEASHPSARGSTPLAVVAAMLSILCGVWFVRAALSRPRLVVLVAPVVVGAVVLALSLLPALSEVWVWVVTELPGGGVLRDSQKFVAPWVLAIVLGAGLAMDCLVRRVPGLRGPGLAVGFGLVLLLSPQLAWGVGGRLSAVTVPPELRSAAARASGLPRAEMGLLPWNQYRRYEWNDDRVSLTIAPRTISQRVLFNDALPLRSGEVPGEDPRAARVSADIASGTSPAQALVRAGVTYIALERDTGLAADEPAVRAVGQVRVDTSQLLVVEVPHAAPSPGGAPRSVVVGWVVTVLTAIVVLVACVATSTRRRLPASLLRSRS